MKKITILIMAAVVCMTMTACRKKKEPVNQQQIQTTAATEATEAAKPAETTVETTAEKTQEQITEPTEKKAEVKTEQEETPADQETIHQEPEISDWGGREDELPIG